MSTVKLNKKKKFVSDGVFHAEIHSFFTRALPQAGYAGFDIISKDLVKQIRIKATKIKKVTGQKNIRIKQLESVIQKRYNTSQNNIILSVMAIKQKGLCAAAQAQSLKYKLLSKLPVRLAANSIIRNCLNDNAKGCQVIISGKLKQQRAKSMKFRSGYMISTGFPKKQYIDVAVRHVQFKQGIMGVKVKIMKIYDLNLQLSAKNPLPDYIQIFDPKQNNDVQQRKRIQQN